MSYVRKLRELPPKGEWFRLQEREHVKTDILRLNPGSWIETKRIIVRAGYYYEPFDMPLDELEERTKRHIMASMNPVVSKRKISLYESNPDIHDEKGANPWGTFTEEHYNKLEQVFLKEKKYICKQIHYRLRGKWLYEQKKGARTDKERELLWLRTFWYVDLEQSQSYQVESYENKQCGMYNPASGGYYGDDYDPAFIAASVVQGLYWINDLHNNGHFEPAYVHPLDCEQDKDKYL